MARTLVSQGRALSRRTVVLNLAKKLGYNLPEQALWEEHRSSNVNETGQEEKVYGSLQELATDVTEQSAE